MTAPAKTSDPKPKEAEMAGRQIIRWESRLCVRGEELREGDDLIFLGKSYRITNFEPYTHPVVTKGEKWRIAYSRKTPTETHPFGMTIEPRGLYEITPQPGDMPPHSKETLADPEHYRAWAAGKTVEDLEGFQADLALLTNARTDHDHRCIKDRDECAARIEFDDGIRQIQAIIQALSQALKA